MTTTKEVDIKDVKVGDTITINRADHGEVIRVEPDSGDIFLLRKGGRRLWVSTHSSPGSTVTITVEDPTNAEVWASFPIGTVFRFHHFANRTAKRIKISAVRYAIEGDTGTYVFNDLDRPQLWQD